MRLYRIKKGGRETGNWIAQWRENGRIVTRTTGTLDRKLAAQRAEAEFTRRQSGNGHTGRAVKPHTGASSAPAGEFRLPSPRVPLSDVLARAFSAPTVNSELPAHSSSFSAENQTKPETAAPATSNGSIPPPPAADDVRIKPRRLYTYGAKAASAALEGVLQRAIRFAGREPAEMDDDERDLIQEGLAEQFQIWFGAQELSPLGKVALGSLVAGAGMWRQGTPLAKTPAPPRLTPAERDTQPAPKPPLSEVA